MFDYTHYVPILRWKRAEKVAQIPEKSTGGDLAILFDSPFAV